MSTETETELELDLGVETDTDSDSDLDLDLSMNLEGISLAAEADSAEVMADKISKNFRHSAEIEALYRFINENDLRREGKLIFEAICQKKPKSKKKLH